jgi:hypothetical protein
MRSHLLLLFLVSLTSFVSIAGFAEWMMKDFCHVSIAQGAVIMNAEAEVTAERSLTILRKAGGAHFVELTAKDGYVTGETLYVKLSNTEGQFVLDVLSKNAEFVDGGCPEAQRINVDLAPIVMPHGEFEGEDVRIQAAWALGHQKVQITPTIVLRPVGLEIREEDSPRDTTKLRGDMPQPSATQLLAEPALMAPVVVDSTTAIMQSSLLDSVIAILYSALWYIIGAALLLFVFVVYRLNGRGGRRMRGSKLSYD